MLIIDPQTTAQPDFYQYMIGAIAPRPIAFISTVDAEGNSNLAPYSFFNAVSSKPPFVVFSPARRATNNTTKDTLDNIEQTKECVINVVSHNIVRQMVLTSQNYPKGVDEFQKSGLTPLASDLVKPVRVAESPVQMECRVHQILPLGTEGGAGNIVVCEVVRMHINENVLDERGRIDPHKIDLVGRLGRANYVRASGNNIFDIVLPEKPLSLGYDSLPENILKSESFDRK
ncbi:MAG: flavin reductase family protein [Saprospiraceae bacterium]|nr:flavin reductase family protein [Saprospiraceae bacterium]